MHAQAQFHDSLVAPNRFGGGAPGRSQIQLHDPQSKRSAGSDKAGSIGIRFQPDPGKVSRCFVILILCPALKRMIVTFVAVESRSKKQMCGVLHDRSWRPQNLEV